MKKQETGKLGEELACRTLRKKGYRIIERNYRCRYGEIDIIARNNKILLFVEVRSKTGDVFGTPAESVTRLKKERLSSSIMSYLESHKGLPQDWRLDFIGIDIDVTGTRPPHIEIIEGALE